MADTTFGAGAMNPEIDWRISAALENVPRGGQDVAEVTNLVDAVEAWTALDPEHRRAATLTVEHPILIDGVPHTSFSSDGIELLSERLPTNRRKDSSGGEGYRHIPLGRI